MIPQALAEAVKPIEKISDIRIFNTGGLGGGSGDGGIGGFGEGLAGQLLAYQTNKPIVDRILKEAGFAEGRNAVDALLGGAMTAGAVPQQPPGAEVQAALPKPS